MADEITGRQGGSLTTTPALELEVYNIDDYYWKNTNSNAGPILPYLNDEVLFRKVVRLIFGNSFSMEICETLRQDFLNNRFEGPAYEFNDLDSNVFGYYRDKKITLNKRLIEEGRRDALKRWGVFLTLVEEFGHHIDHLLRTKYSTIGGDADGDEGRLFATVYLDFNYLLQRSFNYAKFNFGVKNGNTYENSITVDFGVSTNDPSSDQRKQYLQSTQDRAADRGFVKLKNGQVVEVEYFFVRAPNAPVNGAVHEAITAAACVGVPNTTYDDALDEGCAWPDVPTPNPDVLATDYHTTIATMNTSGTIAYHSHHGRNTNWHCMYPDIEIPNYSTYNHIKNKIIEDARGWYDRAMRPDVRGVAGRNGSNSTNNMGLFHIGKLLHMLQDSYARSHTVRHRGFMHTVQQGESLVSIAERFHITWQTIYNNHRNEGIRNRRPNPANIQIGDRFYIPSRIVCFQCYGSQLGSRHQGGDAGRAGDAAFDEAALTSREILRFYSQGTVFENGVFQFLDNNVIVIDDRFINENRRLTLHAYATDEVRNANTLIFTPPTDGETL